MVRTRLAGIVFCLILICFATLTGCESIQTGIAQAIGAPTPAQIRQVQTAMDQLDKDQAALSNANDQALAQKQAQLDAMAITRQKDEQLQQQIVNVASQLAMASPGPFFDSLSSQLNQLHAQRASLQSGLNEQTAQAKFWESEQVKLQAALKSAAQARAKAQQQLDDFATHRQTAINNTAAGVATLGDAVQSFGVPGAKPIADQAAGYLSLLLTGVLGVGGYIAKKKLNEAQATAATAQATATTAQTAASELAGSIETARLANPQLDEQLKASAPVINAYQGPEAKAVVDAVQKANKAA